MMIVTFIRFENVTLSFFRQLRPFLPSLFTAGASGKFESRHDESSMTVRPSRGLHEFDSFPTSYRAGCAAARSSTACSELSCSYLARTRRVEASKRTHRTLYTDVTKAECLEPRVKTFCAETDRLASSRQCLPLLRKTLVS